MGSHASSRGRIHKKSGKRKKMALLFQTGTVWERKGLFEKNGQISHPFVFFKAKSSIGAVKAYFKEILRSGRQ